MLSATPAISEVTALDRYVAALDPSYRYELIETIPGDGYAAHVLEMTSQRWRDESEVDRPLWKHWLTIIEPEQVGTGTALLIVGGGSNERKPPARANPLLAMVAVTTRSVIAELRFRRLHDGRRAGGPCRQPRGLVQGVMHGARPCGPDVRPALRRSGRAPGAREPVA